MKQAGKFPLFMTIILSLLIISIFSGCTEKEEGNSKIKRFKNDKINTYTLSRYVSSHTSGSILPDSPILIRFTDNMVDYDTVGKKENKARFKIKPKVAGKAVWLDRQQLQYIPDEPLKKGEKYSFTLDISSFYADSIKVEPLVFSLRVMTQRINNFRADFVLSESNREEVSYEGEVTFLLDTDFATVKKATYLKVKNIDVPLTWSVTDKTYKFKSELLKRTDVTQPIDFRIMAGLLDLEDDLIRTSNLASLHDMDVILVKRMVDQNSLGLEIEFSDILDRNQDISGYVSVQPTIAINLQKFGNRVLLNGSFEFGKSYTLTIKQGIRNSYDQELKSDFTKVIPFNDELPQIQFLQDGSFMPSGNERKLQFQTINVKRVTVSIQQVYENNLIYYLQKNDLQAKKNDSNRYYQDQSYLGDTVYSKHLMLAEKKNEWLLQELDLSKLIPLDATGLYQVNLSFNKEGAYYRGVKYLGNNRYNVDPNEDGYYYDNGRVGKSIILSDLGVTVKKTDKNYVVFVNDVMTTKPISGAKVQLKSLQNQILDEAGTNGDGKAVLADAKTKGFFIEVNYDKQRSIVKIDEMRLNTSTYDVDGVQVSSSGTRAYIYTERGVYRPGDPINLSMIFRNSDKTFPDNHPVSISISNPKHQKVLERTIKDGLDGFYNFNYSTKTTDPTGTWKIRIEAGSSVFYHDLKIETVVAERLKVELETESEAVYFEDEELDVKLQANYLFGAPGAKLEANVEYTLMAMNKRFASNKYNDFSFNNWTIDFKEIKKSVFMGRLDDAGLADFKVTLPKNVKAPSALAIKLEADVKETGGRSSKKKIFLEYNPYPAYVGVKHEGSSWVKVGKSINLQTVLLDSEGEPLPNEKLKVRIYHNKRYWWWEYDRYNYNRRSYKSSQYTDLILEQNLISSDKAQDFEFSPNERGQYLVEVTHINGDGEQHVSTIFVRSSYWGNPRANIQDAGMIDLKLDKKNYDIGDVAEISFPTPKEGNILVSLEKGDQIVDSWWQKPSGLENTIVKVPVKAAMAPNIYAFIAVLQPQQQSDNDRPIRMFGYIPIMVADPTTKQQISMDVPDILRPNKAFKCKIQANEKTQFTIAVVDEGLLSLTDFNSPDAWEEFFKKQRLDVTTSDNYGYIIGANKADVFKTHSIGGGIMMERARKEKLAPEESKRFKPVCMFQGPIYTDENGYAEVEFSMPEYMGTVRIMVVSAEQGRYGSISQTVEVMEDIVLLPTIPRVLAPGDEFIIPVEVFATKEGVGKVKLSISCELPIEIMGETTKTLVLESKEQKSVRFTAKVQERVGNSKISITADYGSSVVASNTEITVRPLSARVYRTEEKECSPGNEISFDVPDDGILGSNKAYIVVKRLPRVDLGRRLNWLIRYPYGCVEQTTSAVFPQLFLSEFIKDENVDDTAVVNNINEAINRLRRFQTPSGGMGYWPGSSRENNWGTNYAGHFLIEAKAAGYFVPQEILDNWTRYQQREAKNFQYDGKHIYMLREQVYRLYLLAKVDKPEMGAMNFIREKNISEFDDTMRWILAATYKLAGADTEAERLRKSAGIITRDYLEHSGSYGSGLRDKAMILEAMQNFGDTTEAANMFRTISEQISDKHWYSTQTTGYSLLALGKYIKSFVGDKNVTLEGQIDEADGTTKSFKSSEYIYKKEITKSYGKKVGVEIYNNSKMKKCYVSLDWSGVPIRSSEELVQDGIAISKSFSSLDLKNLKQGDVLTMTLNVKNLEKRYLENIALVQLLPSGWEIENERVNPDEIDGRNSRNNNWNDNRNDNRNNRVEYTDIRDDRIMWFFDLAENQNITVSFKIRNVTEGTFYMPATSCEVMYDNRYKSSLPGETITIKK